MASEESLWNNLSSDDEESNWTNPSKSLASEESNWDSIGNENKVNAKDPLKYSFEPSDKSEPYLQSTSAAEKKYGLPENLLNQLINTESEFNPDALNPSGATGIAQIVPKWHPKVDATDPNASIDYAASLLKKHHDKFGDWDSALAAYNAGPNRVSKGMDKLPEETKNYLAKINAFRVKEAEKAKVGEVPVIEDLETPKFEEAGKGTIQGKLMTEQLAPSVQEFDTLKANPILAENFVGEVTETLQGYANLATQPMEVIRGGAEFALSLPGFGLGVIGATQKIMERMGRPFTFNDLYDSASEGMENLQTYWGEKMVEPLLGKPSAVSQLVGQTAMAPAIGISMVAGNLSNAFRDNPNVQGLIKFLGDIGGLVALSRIYHGSKAEVTAKAEEIVERAKVIANKESLLDKTFDEAIKAAQVEVIKTEKNQLELEAKELQKNLDYEKMIKNDLSSKTKKIKQIKQKQGEILDVQVNKALEKLPDGKDRSKIKRTEEVKVEEVVDEPATDLDLDTSIVREPIEFSTQRSPFREHDAEATNAMHKVYGEREKGVANDPELFTGKLINDVNRYLNGEEVPIEQVREGLSSLSMRAEEIKDMFVEDPTYPMNFINWQEMVGEAAKWARKAERVEVDPFAGIDLKPAPKVKAEPFAPDIWQVEQLQQTLNAIKAVGDPMASLIQNFGRDLGSRLYDSISDILGKEGDFPKGNRAEEVFANADRKIVERTGEPSVRLNTMIPLDEVPRQVRKALGGAKKLFDSVATGDIYRNKKLWNKTGYWLDKDGNFRYEIPNYIDIYNKKNKTRFNWLRLRDEGPQKLPDVLKNDELYKAVPKLKDVTVIVNEDLASQGMYSKTTNSIMMRLAPDFETLVHEIQHAVESKANTKFQGTNITMQEVKKMSQFTNELIATAKSPEVKRMARVFREDYLRNATNPDAVPMYTMSDLYREAKKSPDDYWKLQELDKRIFSEDPFESYQKDPGEALARLETERSNMSDQARKKEAPWETLDKMLEGEGIEPSGVELYSGIPVGKAIDLLKDTVKKFKGRIIKTVNKDQSQIIKDIAKLHTEGKFDADITFSKGVMWRGTGIEPGLKFDKRIEKEGVTKADVGKKIPLDDKSINSIMFDPPFLVEATKPGKERTGIMAKRFTAFRTVDEMWSFYKDTINESFRVLKPGGKLVTKTQDITYGNRMWASSSEIYNFATQAGFKPVDRFILEKEHGMPLPPNVKVQKHARKSHSDFWVFEKPKKSYTYPEQGGVKLLDITSVPAEGAKALVAGAKKLSDYTKRARGMKAFRPAQAARMLREEFNRSFIDRSGNIRNKLLDKLGDDGYSIVQKMYLSKGASSLAANNLKQMSKEVYSGLSKDGRRILDNLILADRMIDIGKYKTAKQFKFPEGLEPTNSAAYNELFQFIEKIDAKTAADLKQRAGAYFEWMKKPLKDLLDNGLISEEEFNNLIAHNYRQIKLVDVFDKRYQAKVGKKKRTVYDSGIESLARGRQTDVFEPSSEIMALEVFNRSYGRILNNKANQSLLELAKSQPENEFVRIKEKKGDKIPSGWDRTFVYENGERKSMYLSPEMSKEWITSNPEMSYKASQMLRYASLSPVLRTFATGINWGFALANLPRDIQHVWFTARAFKDGKWEPIYNPNMPVFAAQMGRDMASVFTDAVTRKGRYEEYIKDGGGMEFLVHQGRLLQRGRHVEGGIDKVYDWLGYFGETSEIMTRLAIRERAIRKGKSKQEATFIARDYMDFGQGGGIAKAADNAFPYLNAAIQGTRGLLRSFKPGSGSALSSSYKLAQYAALTSGLYIAMTKMHPETTKALKGSIDMQNNQCLPLGDDFGFEDSRGQMRYPYLKIPIDPGQKFFKTFFEASTDKWLGNEVDVNRVVDSLKELSPASVSELPPTISGVLGYVTNKDFWLNEDIWRKTDKAFDYPRSKEEYIPGKTPQAYIDFGATTGLSPERTKFAVEELVTNGTVWSYLLGQGYDAMFGDLPKDKKEMHLAETLSKLPVIKRFFGLTNPYSQFATGINEAKEKSEVDRWIQNRGLDMRVEGYLVNKNVSRKEVVDYIAGFKDKKVFDRLKDRFEFQQKIKDLPNRSFWLRMKSLNVEARAEVYKKRLDNASEEERSQLMNELQKVIAIGGVVTKGFREEVSKLQ